MAISIDAVVRDRPLAPVKQGVPENLAFDALNRAFDVVIDYGKRGAVAVDMVKQQGTLVVKSLRDMATAPRQYLTRALAIRQLMHYAERQGWGFMVTGARNTPEVQSLSGAPGADEPYIGDFVALHDIPAYKARLHFSGDGNWYSKAALS